MAMELGPSPTNIKSMKLIITINITLDGFSLSSFMILRLISVQFIKNKILINNLIII